MQTNLIPLYLLIAAIPMGAGGQNIVQALAVVWLITILVNSEGWKSCWTKTLDYKLHIPLLLFIGFLFWCALSATLNPENPAEKLVDYIAGYLPLALLPVAITLVYPNLTYANREKLLNVAALVLALMAITSVQQYFWGARPGLEAFSGKMRAQAFYTHPLTLAYITCLAWPPAVHLLIKHPRQLSHWVIAASLFICIIGSQSRVVMPLCALILAGNLLTLLQARQRLVLISLFLMALFAVAVTENRVSTSFHRTFAGNLDRHTDKYPDDRVAFWHAHWHMFTERPLLGHGAHPPKDSRIAAYNAIGLEEFPKKYTAHNQYLQLAVEGGIVGLALFLGWLTSIFWLLWRQRFNHPMVWTFAQSWALFSLAIISQNAFQDSEVRLGLMLLAAASFSYLPAIRR